MAYKIIKLYVDADGITEERWDVLDETLVEIFGDDILFTDTDNVRHNDQSNV